MTGTAPFLRLYHGCWPDLKLWTGPVDRIARTSFGVVIPAHNNAGCVVDTARRVLANMEPEDRLAIIENGSTDGTWEALTAAFSGHSQILLDRLPDGDAAAARNRGVELTAPSEFVCFCDADDPWRHDKLATVRRALSVAELDIIMHPMLAIGHERLSLEGAAMLDKQLPRSPVLLDDMMKYGNIFATSALIIRRSLLSFPVFSNGLRHTQDFEAWCLLAQNYRCPRLGYLDHLLGVHNWMGGLSKALVKRLANEDRIVRSYSQSCSFRVRARARLRSLLRSAWYCLRHGTLRDLPSIIWGPVDPALFRGDTRAVPSNGEGRGAGEYR
ncbi:glycosyltransferase family 2 protein [Radicibacter daui]|uniref:glycosyltransferase family 2 protein n=1 Tax=Radicibacter daui TaxID=3064829 RepID=UPI004046987B